MLKTGIFGAGNVGANTAFFLAERNIGPVAVHDEQEGLATGKALDIMEMAPLGRYRYPIYGTDDEADVLSSDIVCIAAGSPGTSDASGAALYEKNEALIRDFARKLSNHTGVVIIVTEPVDELVTLFTRESGIDSRRVLGLSGCLAAARLRYFVSQELGCFAEDVDALALGYRDEAMVIPADYCRVSGIPAHQLIGEDTFERLVEDVKNSEQRMLELNKRSTPFYAAASVAADVVEAIVADSGRILSVSTVLDGEFNVHGAALSVPAMVGAKGVSKILTPKLDASQSRNLSLGADRVKQTVS